MDEKCSQPRKHKFQNKRLADSELLATRSNPYILFNSKDYDQLFYFVFTPYLHTIFITFSNLILISLCCTSCP